MTLYLSMFYARRAEKRWHFIFIHIYKHLRQDVSVETCGLGSKNCCMQQKRCMIYV